MTPPLTGQVAVTGTAQQLGNFNPQTYTIKASSKNANPVFIGPVGVTVTTGHRLDPGDTFSYERRISNDGPLYQVTLAEIFAVGTAGTDTVTWFGSP